jgi:SNF2 family DNA or RNA helicase
MHITELQISKALGESTYSIGKLIYEAKPIFEHEIEKGNGGKLVFTSKLSQEDQTTEQRIEITPHNNEIIINGECSCLDMFDCKHVAAACIALSNVEKKPSIEKKTNPVKPKDAVNSWLKTLTPNTKPPDPQLSLSFAQERIIYRICEDGMKQDICIYHIGSNQRCQLQSTNQLNSLNNINQILNTDDANTLAILHNANHEAQSILNGEFGYLLATSLLKTEKCYYKSSPKPLTLSKIPLPLMFQWKKGTDKTLWLVSNIKLARYHILQTTPLLIIDSTTNVISQLSGQYDYATIQKLINIPPIPEAQAKGVYDTLLDNFPKIKIQLPEIQTTDTIKQLPTPHLKLYSTKSNKSHKFIQYEIYYDKHRVEPYKRNETEIIENKDNKTIIIRSLESEDKSLDIIKNCGFIEIIDTDKPLESHMIDLTISYDMPPQKALGIWSQFMQSTIPHLKALGWVIEIDESFNMEFTETCQMMVDSSKDDDGWFSLTFDIEINGNRIQLVPLLTSIFSEYDSIKALPETLILEHEPNKYIEIKTKEITPIINTIYELLDKTQKDGSFKIKAFDALLVDAELLQYTSWTGTKEIIKLSEKLSNHKKIETVKPPKSLSLPLRDYQHTGFNWMHFLNDYGFSGILADDMGLGKTFQVLSLLLKLKEEGKLNKPAIIIVPTSLVTNWEMENQKFTPTLKLLVLYGKDRNSDFDKINEYDIIITTYGLITRDQDTHQTIQYSYAILDEAQAIKNHKAITTRNICKINSVHRIAMSGTPIENHLGELWSLFNFLMPGYLGTIQGFNTTFRKPIEDNEDVKKQQLLNKKINPFVLRRDKKEVLKEMPEKTIKTTYIEFGPEQAKLYESIKLTTQQEVIKLIKNKGNKASIQVLTAIMQLRQTCCDPRLLNLKRNKLKSKKSAKTEAILLLIKEIQEQKGKVIIYSSFKSMLLLLEPYLKKNKIRYSMITGGTIDRGKQISDFQNGKTDIILITKAASSGVNLTEANHVIIIEPWWNPAVESQTIDRAHRMGQKRHVTVHKLIVKNTIEENILVMQQKKQSLLDNMYEGNKQAQKMKLTGNDLKELLGISQAS